MEFFNGVWFNRNMYYRIFHNLKPLILFLIFIIFFHPPLCFGKPIKQVISTSPSWETFTNMDGTGLYHEILASIFTPHAIRVIHKYTNPTRGLYMVKNDLANLYTCDNDISEFPDLVLARYPMYEGQFHAIFKKRRTKNWQGVSSLANQRVVWRRGYYKPSEFDVKMTVLETDSGPLALAQIILDRGDFYIDDLDLLKESISKNKLPFDMNDYRIELVGQRAYYPVFKLSERGNAIMELYDRGIERLHRSGELKKIFKKYHQPYPHYDIF